MKRNFNQHKRFFSTNKLYDELFFPNEFKKYRKKECDNTGLYLLTLRGKEINDFFEEVETDINKNIELKDREYILISLLYISITNYFQRNYDFFSHYFPVLMNAASSRDRILCQAAVLVVYWAADEYSDNRFFLRELLDHATNWLLNVDSNQRLIYNAIFIYSETGKMCPGDVSIRIEKDIFYKIMASICDSDEKLSYIAVSCAEIYFKHIQNETLKNFSDLLFTRCVETIKSEHEKIGAIKCCHVLYNEYPTCIDKQSLIGVLVKSLEDIHCKHIGDTLELLIELSDSKPGFIASDHSHSIIKILCNLIENNISDRTTLKLMTDFVLILNISDDLYNKIISIIKIYILDESYYEMHESAYQILMSLLKVERFQNKVFPIEYFTKPHISHGLLSALELQPQHHAIMIPILEKVFRKISTKSNDKYESLICIDLVEKFGKMLSIGLDSIFERIKHFCYSEKLEVRLKMTKILSMFKREYSSPELIRLSLYDGNKQVRLSALKQIEKHEFPLMLSQILSDSSNKVKRAAISLILSFVKNDPYNVKPGIISFINEYLIRDVCSNDVRHSSKSSKLLPDIATHFCQFFAPSIDFIGYLCVKFILHGDDFPEAKPLTQRFNSDFVCSGNQGFPDTPDLRTVIHRDFVYDTLIFEDSRMSQIYYIVNRPYFETRDECMLKTLCILSDYLKKYSYQIIPAISKLFESSHCEQVYVAALEALHKYILLYNSKKTFYETFPDVVPLLLKLISDDCPKNIAILAIKTMASIGISANIKFLQPKQTNDYLLGYKEDSFFTDYVMENLIPLLNSPDLAVFDVIAAIYQSETVHALKYLSQVVEAFVKVFTRTGVSTDKGEFFMRMASIIYHVKNHFTPFVARIEQILIENIKNLSCINVCIMLSFQLRYEFKVTAHKLFELCIDLMFIKNFSNSKFLYKFIVYAILFQGCSVEIFLESVERIMIFNDLKTNNMLFSPLLLLFQHTRNSIYASRVAILCFSQIKNQTSTIKISRLLLTLIAFHGLSYEYVYNFAKLNNVEIPDLDDLWNGGDIDKVIRVNPIDFNSKYIDSLKLDIPRPEENVFKRCPEPSLYTRQWVDNLCKHMVSNSSSVSIRACKYIISKNQQFMRKIFPIAFVSCWKDASDNEKKYFSEIMKSVLTSSCILDPALLNLAEILDKCGLRLLIDDMDLAKVCKSNALSVYYLQRRVRENPDDINAVENLMKIIARRGQVRSARGILQRYSDRMGNYAIKWIEALGEWEKALDIYEKENDILGRIRSYGHLEQWDKVCELESEFNNMDKSEQSSIAFWFARSFYHSNNFKKVDEYIRHCPSDFNQDVSIFKALYYVASSQYTTASAHIDACFDTLVENRQIYSENDIYQVLKNLVIAQYLTELSEVIDVKTNNVSKEIISERWNQRLVSFSLDSEAWRKLIEIRSLLPMTEKHKKSCLQLVSELRKERRWRLAHMYLDRLFERNHISGVELALNRVKVMWASGERSQAIDCIRYLNGENVNVSKEFSRICEPMSSEENFEDPHFRSRCLRFQADWQYSVYKDNIEIDVLKKIITTYHKAISINAQDYKAWAGMAYASARALSKKDKKSEYATQAIESFLMATELKPENGIEYLVQLFSIFVRYAKDIELTNEMKEKFKYLSPSAIISIIPQIITHISHKESKVSTVINAVISKFSDVHFESIFYDLNTFSKVEDLDKRNTAKDLLLKLGNNHRKTFNEMKLFIKSMHKCAVSQTELLLAALNDFGKLFKCEDYKNAVQIIEDTYASIKNNPSAEIKSCNKEINAFVSYLPRYAKGQNSKDAYECYKTLVNCLANQVSKKDNINLKDVAPVLAEKSEFSFAIPGKYSVHGNHPLLHHIDPILQVLTTQQHPRVVKMIDYSGKSWQFLLKGNQDIRLDQRIMQSFYLVNSLLKTNGLSSNLGGAISTYSIIPFALNAGFIGWIVGTDTLYKYVSEYRKMKSISTNIESEICEKEFFAFKSLTHVQKIEAFGEVAKHCKADELREVIWLISSSPSDWIDKSYRYTVSTSVMSIVGYMIGLGDRHPSNILIQHNTGCAIHIDFGDSFEKTIRRQDLPEQVPFRLTRMISNAFESSSIEGLFRSSCEDVLYVLREEKSPIIAQLEVFIHEPILMGGDRQSQHYILSRVEEKLDGYDTMWSTKDKDTAMSVSEQVDALITVASDPCVYVRHFIGWNPFW